MRPPMERHPTTPAPAVTTAQAKDDQYDKKRAREFYRYYEALRLLSETPEETWTDLNSNEAVAKHHPASSPDKALTAFCQLAAVRLEMRRAMIFFFDSNYAYVLAEATRTLSLQDDDSHELEDELWLGATKIPRGFSVCEHTVNLPSNQGTNSQGEDADLIHIINDLADDTRFCNRPYVTDGPKARFYAGVPITTPKGLNIGAFCVLDDQPHEGLTKKQVHFMREMSTTIMGHVDMVRIRGEHKRLSNMTQALGDFMQAQPSSTPSSAKSTKAESPSPERRPSRTRRSIDGLRKTSITRASPLNRQVSQTPSKEDQDATSKPNETLQSRIITKAASLIRGGLDADGVLFLDASTIGSKVPTRYGTEDTTATDTDHSARTTGFDDTHSGDQPCTVLGASYAKPASHKLVLRRTLASLLKYHRRGAIWNFGDEGDDYSSATEGQVSSNNEEKASTDFPPTKSSSTAPPNKRTTRASLGKLMQNLFPKVRSICIIGLWDPVRQKNHSACIIFSYSPIRIFDDTNFLDAFCLCVTAQLGRVDVEQANNAKSDFISSISHELRSPLHGILGTTEMLLEEVTDPNLRQMVSQIDSCGRTLSDTTEHLLEYSRINSITKQVRLAHGIRGRGILRGSSTVSARADLNSDCFLDQIIEEVVESTVYSWCCSRSPQALLDSQVTTIISIDRSTETSWSYRCRIAVGGMKRIAINLIMNALKYTSSGNILVKLSINPPQGAMKRPSAVFAVSDSGRGMSQEFLDHNLYRAFTQEDDLNEGTGLGMNMVAKIVKAMGGTIKVQSEKNEGTMVTVTMPLEISKYDKKLAADELERTANAFALPALNISFLGTPSAEGRNVMNDAHRLQVSMLRRTCSECLNITLPVPTWELSDNTAFAMILESDLPQLQRLLEADATELEGPAELDAVKLMRKKPLVVICRDYMSVRRIKASPLFGLMHAKVECISQPCGPNRLAAAFQKCLDTLQARNQAATSSDSSDSLLPPVFTLPNRDAREKVEAQASTAPTAPVALPHLKVVHETPPAEVPDVSGHPSIDTDPIEESESRGMQSETMEQKPGHELDWIRSEVAHGHRPSASSTTSSQTGSQTGSKIPLLLVDDNAINLKILTTYARKNGHKFLVGHDGLEALEAYKAAYFREASKRAEVESAATYRPLSPDSATILAAVVPYGSGARLVMPKAILLDLSMPIMDGFTAAREIRKFERQQGIEPGVTIIALTGLGSAEAQRDALAAGIDLFLMKPVRLRELTTILREVSEGPLAKMDEDVQEDAAKDGTGEKHG